MISIKTPQQIEIMREGGKILATILNEVAKAVQPGISTKELDELAQELIFSYGAKPAFLGYQDFPAALCVSINEVIVHAVPRGDKLKKGDVVGLDLGILYPHKDCDGCFMVNTCGPEKKVEGLYTDMAITVGVGKIGKEAQKLIDVTKRALEIGIEHVKPGNHIGDIGFAIQQYVESQGFSVIRNLVGHGVGKKVHEPPNIPNFGKKGEGEELKPGMTLAIEPMVAIGGHELEKIEDGHGFRTKDKSLTAHFEHTIVVTEKGYEILTRI
jgi:methionyl aminopeptidase